jgi:hypothetical protein
VFVNPAVETEYAKNEAALFWIIGSSPAGQVRTVPTLRPNLALQHAAVARSISSSVQPADHDRKWQTAKEHNCADDDQPLLRARGSRFWWVPLHEQWVYCPRQSRGEERLASRRLKLKRSQLRWERATQSSERIQTSVSPPRGSFENGNRLANEMTFHGGRSAALRLLQAHPNNLKTELDRLV